jgi:preprotein translocase subunit SecG
MGIVEIIGGMLLIIVCAIICFAVTVQESKGGLGAISGESPSFFDKNRGKTKEAMLVRASAIAGIAMCVVTLIVLIAMR